MKGEKTGGRKKGTPNKTTQEVREMFSQLLSENIDQLRNDLSKLEPYQRVNAFLKLSQFLIPRPMESKITISSPVEAWENLTKEERLRIFDETTNDQERSPKVEH